MIMITATIIQLKFLVIFRSARGRLPASRARHPSYSMVTFSKSEIQAGGARSPFMVLAKVLLYSEL